jgi:hypothetical protein
LHVEPPAVEQPGALRFPAQRVSCT